MTFELAQTVAGLAHFVNNSCVKIRFVETRLQFLILDFQHSNLPRPAATNNRHADPFGDMGMFDKPPEFKTKRRRSETSRLGVFGGLT